MFWGDNNMHIISCIDLLFCCFLVKSIACGNLVNFEGFVSFWCCLEEIMILFPYGAITFKVIRKILGFGWVEMTF